MAYVASSSYTSDKAIHDSNFSPSYSFAQEHNLPILLPPELPVIARSLQASITNDDVRNVSEGAAKAVGKKNGRKGVKKSRAGCFTCKRQKLKCEDDYKSKIHFCFFRTDAILILTLLHR